MIDIDPLALALVPERANDFDQSVCLCQDLRDLVIVSGKSSVGQKLTNDILLRYDHTNLHIGDIVIVDPVFSQCTNRDRGHANPASGRTGSQAVCAGRNHWIGHA